MSSRIIFLYLVFDIDVMSRLVPSADDERFEVPCTIGGVFLKNKQIFENTSISNISKFKTILLTSR